MSDALDAALAYLRRGWCAVPVHTPDGTRCSCGRRDCPSPGKHPRVRWETYQGRAATEEEARAWWRRWPAANVAVVTGAVSGLVVLDVDPRHGGDETLRDLEAMSDPLPPTVEARTGGGGRHLYFAHPGRFVRSGPRAPGLDMKADGGTVVAPPSRHASGGRYSWVEGRSPDEIPLAAMPSWLVESGEPVREPVSGVGGGGPGRAAVIAPRTAPEQREFAELWAALGIELAPGDGYYRCPLHDDRHPSLHVDADGCRWYCFGCGRGGGPGRLRRLVRARRVGTAVSRSRPRPVEPGERAEVVVPGTWLQWPTVQPGGDQKAVGESRFQDALFVLAGGRAWGGVRRPWHTARLAREVDNPVDPDAVRVEIDGRCVGYLPRADAPRFHAVIDRLAARGVAATARARLVGGWERGAGGRGSIGVVLDVDPRVVEREVTAPFLPRGGGVAVAGEEEHQDALARFGEGLVVAELRDDGARLDVLVAGEEAGALSPTLSARYRPLIAGVGAAGFPATCAARITRGRTKLELTLFLPRALADR